MLGPIANEFQSIVTLEDTLLRALAGYKLVCELLQKSLGLWIADPKERTLHGGAWFIFAPFNQFKR